MINMKIVLSLKILFVSFSCAAQQRNFGPKGDCTTAINNAVNDFYKTSSLFKKDISFSVSYRIVNSDIVEVDILGNSNKFYIDGDKPLNRLPTNFIEYNNKIFYWYDINNKGNSNAKVINKLQQYKLIEYNTDIIEHNIDDKKKGVSYYFCIKDLSRYKKIKSSSSKNKIPKLSCK